MDDQKIENLLNLALDATAREREKSQTLEVGYEEETRTWEVIVRYSGDLLSAARENWQIVMLSGGYAIITLPQEEVDALAALPEIEYIEKPKRLYFTVDAGRAASCISQLQTPEFGLFGSGVLIGLLDSGVDYFLPDFRNEDGTTRIVSMWDQTYAGSVEREAGVDVTVAGGTEESREADAEEMTRGEAGTDGTEGSRNTDAMGARRGAPPQGFARGREYSAAEINEALMAGSRPAGLALVPEQDAGGHGTQVLGIAAGNGRASGGRYRGVAPESEIIVVKLATPQAGGFPRTTELMQGLEYVIRKAEELGRPIAINISIGNVYGSHRGTSLLETYIDMMASRGRSVICVGTGNEGNVGGHAGGVLAGDEAREIAFQINDFEPSMNLQLWKNYADEYRITLVHPNGQMAGPFGREAGTSRYILGNTQLLVYYGEPSPYQVQQEIFFDFIPQGNYIDSGVWRIILTPERLVTGEYEMWLIDSRARGSGTQFLQPMPDTTVTIPATASQVIAVGAYDARRNAYAPFSGRGWPESRYNPYNVRPDLVAPGVEITTTASGGGYVSVTGTSFATPFVTGAAALLMEWGIVRGNDPFLYGEKVKAYLRRGARPLPGFTEYPNEEIGYGVLCVRDSLPV